jgi:hypothetical protein
MKADSVSQRFHAAAKLERVPTKRIEGWRRSAVARAFSAGVSLHIPALSVRAFLQTVTPLDRGADPKRHIWMLSKGGLVEDSRASLGEAPWATCYDASRMCLTLLAERMLPSFLDNNVYASDDPESLAAKRKLRDVWREVLRNLPRSRRPAAIITSGFGYFVEREFAGACEEEGFPFVAIHKESFKAPGRLRFFSTTYPLRGAFTGRRILVYNEYERDLLVATGIAPKSTITITGMPRLDRIHLWRRAQGAAFGETRRPTVVAFAFAPGVALPRMPRKERTNVAGGMDVLEPEFAGLTWGSLFTQYHEALVQMARDNPDMRVLLKTKARERDGRAALDFVQSLNPPLNFEVVVGGDPLPLLTACDAAVGFNTTALCEAIAIGIPVVVPNFAEAVTGPTADFVTDLRQAVFYANTAQELASIPAKLARDRTARWPALDPEREAVLDKWVGNADGAAGKRVAAALYAESEDFTPRPAPLT